MTICEECNLEMQRGETPPLALPQSLVDAATKAILTGNNWKAKVIEAEKQIYRQIWEQAEKDATAALQAAHLPALLAALRSVAIALDALLEERPLLAAKQVGATTLGNHRAEAWAVLRQVLGENWGKEMERQ